MTTRSFPGGIITGKARLEILEPGEGDASTTESRKRRRENIIGSPWRCRVTGEQQQTDMQADRSSPERPEGLPNDL